MTPIAHPAKRIYSVTQLTAELRRLLEADYSDIWVEGEISGLARPASGHLYFSLKEVGSVVRCAFFRQRQLRGAAALTEGMQVLIQGQVTVYEARGDMQLIVAYMEPVGEGALRRAFEILKQKLSAEGRFDARHKRSLPAYPERIGIITSDTGAALQDITSTLARRLPGADVIVYPSLVQGDSAVQQLCDMIRLADRRREVDVIIIARGGGSLQDLQAFNAEALCRAIFDLSIPCISGVGHETDFTICDLVADHRAATPTGAAQAAVPDAAQLRLQVRDGAVKLANAAQRYIRNRYQQLDHAGDKLIHPADKLRQYRQRQTAHIRSIIHLAGHRITAHRLTLQRHIGDLTTASPTVRLQQATQQLAQQRTRLLTRIDTRLQQLGQTLQHRQAALQALHPQNTLNRGFAILQDAEQRIITSPQQTAPGDRLRATVAAGRLNLSVDHEAG